MVDESHGQLAGGETNVFLGVGVDHVIDSGFGRAASLAAGNLGAGEVLELQGDVLDDVCGDGSLAYPLQESPGMTERALVVGEGWHQLGQSLGKVGNLVRWPVRQLADVQ